MPKVKMLGIGVKVQLKSYPCSSCPPWSQRNLKRGMTGKLVRIHSNVYAIAWDEFAYSTMNVCDVCRKHVEILEDKKDVK